MLFIEAWQFIVDHPGRFFSALLTHVELSVAALFFAIAIAVPLGVWVSGKRRAAITAITAANIGRTLPSLAVLALVMPVLGTGFAPSLFALTLLALPPILINTYTAVRQVDPDIIDAARGMGMTNGEIVRKIELPLATPVCSPVFAPPPCRWSPARCLPRTSGAAASATSLPRASR
jgi:osmoprotectant transport system permease protein